MSSITDSTAQLVGAWKLLSFDVVFQGEQKDLPSIKPLGERPLGRIMFSPTGYMSATLTSRDVAKPLGLGTEEWAQISDADVLRTSKALTTYSGVYNLYTDEGELRLQSDVEVALNPNWIGKPQKRKVKIEEIGGKVFLTLEPLQLLVLENGAKTRGILRWEKLPEH